MSNRSRNKVAKADTVQAMLRSGCLARYTGGMFCHSDSAKRSRPKEQSRLCLEVIFEVEVVEMFQHFRREFLENRQKGNDVRLRQPANPIRLHPLARSLNLTCEFRRLLSGPAWSDRPSTESPKCDAARCGAGYNLAESL